MPPAKKPAAKSGKKKKKENAGNNAAAKVAAPPRTTGYRVECSSYPSGNGCYSGQDLSDDYIDSCTTTKVVGSYDTMEQAKKADIKERNSHCEFDDWAEEFYDENGKEPPYFSIDGENYDDDETIHIYIVDIAKEVAAKSKAVAGKQKAMEAARSSKPPVKKRAKTTTFGPAMGTFKLEDMDMFVRILPSEYGTRGKGKSSFVYLIQRLSDRNYAMRSLCLENSGASFSSFKLPRVTQHCIHWIPDSNLNDHANNDTILDTFHTDLFHHKTGQHSLTAETLLAYTKPNMECLFLTNFSKGHDNACSKAIVQAIT